MMTRSRHTLLRNLIKVLDLGIVSGAFFLALALGSEPAATHAGEPFSAPSVWSRLSLAPSLSQLLAAQVQLSDLLLFSAYLLVCRLVFQACGLHQSHRLSHRLQRLSEAIMASSLMTAVLLLARESLSLALITRPVLLIFWGLLFCFVFFAREIGLLVLQVARSRGRNLRQVVVVGEGSQVRTLSDALSQDESLGYRVLHIISPEDTHAYPNAHSNA